MKLSLRMEVIFQLSYKISNSSFNLYRIAGKFGGEFNLAVWLLVRAQPNLIPAKFYIRQNFVGCHLIVEQTRSEF